MVDVFGGAGLGLGLRGKRGLPGPKGPSDKRGKHGDSSGLYSQYFQYMKINWDIDFNLISGLKGMMFKKNQHSNC